MGHRHPGRFRWAIASIALFAAAGTAALAQGWSAWQASPSPRMYASMTYDVGRERIVLFGGYQLHPVYQQYSLADTWELEPGGWSLRASSTTGPTPRFQAAMAYDAGRGRTVLVGGKSRTNAALDGCWEWDGTTWRTGTALPASAATRYGAAMAYDATRGVIVLFGGATDNAFLADTWEYSGGAWSSGPAAPAGLTPRIYHAAAYHRARGSVIVFGGLDGVVGKRNDTWQYDGNAWTPGPAAPAALLPRASHAIAYDDGRGLAVLLGGDVPGSTTVKDAWTLDATGWSQTPDLPAEPRYAHAMAYDATRGRVVAFGGAPQTDSLETFDEAWEYDGSGWVSTPGAIPAALSRRLESAMVYDERRRRAVLFGGIGRADDFADTWEFDGKEWRPGPAAPPGMVERGRHAMAYDAFRARTVLAGGFDATASVRLADTWEYDGAAWTRGPDMPVVRLYHAMAYDRVRRVTVLFGGQVAGLRNDTLEYDGASWTNGPAAPGGLVARYRHAMAYDERLGRTVLAGGETPTQLLSDSWMYDGGAWTPLPALPGSVTQGGMVYDAEQRRLVLAGGRGWGTYYFDGTWWAGPQLLGTIGQATAYDRDGARTIVFGGVCCISGQSDEREQWELQSYASRILVGGGLAAPNPDRVETRETSGALDRSFDAYGSGAWGVNVSSGDLDRALPDEIVTGPGPGPIYGPTVRGFGSDGTRIAKVNFFAYATLRYGVNVAPADVDADSYAELLTGAGPGSVFGPHVRGFDYDAAAVSPIQKINFFAYATLRYGVNVSRGDLEGDDLEEIVTGTGPSPAFAPMIRGFDVVSGSVVAMAKIQFWAFPTLAWGINVSAGDADGDGYAELCGSPGPGGTPAFPGRARGFDYDAASVQPAPGFDVTGYATSYGGRLALAELRRPERTDLLLAPGPDPAFRWTLKTYRYDAPALAPLLPELVIDASRSYGVNVAAGRLGPAV